MQGGEPLSIDQNGLGEDPHNLKSVSPLTALVGPHRVYDRYIGTLL